MRGLGFLAALSLLASACAAPAQVDQPASGGGTAECDAEAASFASGQPYTDTLAEEARQAAGAELVRKLEPGMAYTMEFRGDRLNLEVDARDTVSNVRCG